MRPYRRSALQFSAALLGGDLVAALEDLQGLGNDVGMLAGELNLIAHGLAVFADIDGSVAFVMDDGVHHAAFAERTYLVSVERS
jgi:hypothetical protein